MLGAFRVRSFRFQWTSDLLTSWAAEMETVILGWYVLTQSGSVLLLTVFGSLQFFGTLAAPMFGVLSDRLGGRLMLCVMRSIYAALAAVLMLLAAAGGLTPASVLTVAAVAGFVRPNDLVMRNSLIGETIPPAHLMGALGLSRATMDSARVCGALAGAGLSTVLGLGLTYVVVTTFYLAGLALTFRIARPTPVPDPAAPRRSASPARELKAGLARVLATPSLLALMWLAFLINLTAYPASGGLLPYVARNVYRVDATGLGWLVAAFAFGGLLASMAMVLTGGTRRPERSTFVCTAVWYAILLGFGHLQTLGAGLLALLVAGFVQNVAMISMAATLLAAAGAEFRGRVMGVRTLAVYGLPIGLMAAGFLIERIGYPLTITVSAALGLLFTVLIAVRWRAAVWRRTAYSLSVMSS
ncbi:MAG TPA: MFS transporter [Candidatus Binatia bacterium]|nr:MFS transporter [Candidatus Binatia bacterium]